MDQNIFPFDGLQNCLVFDFIRKSLVPTGFGVEIKTDAGTSISLWTSAWLSLEKIINL